MNTTIANRIYIEDPTEEVKAWVKSTLAFPNPEYEKKERMGFWTGNIPRELRLYEWNGKTLIVPFGVCRELMPLLKGSLVSTDFRQDSVIAYGDPLPLYDYQKEAVDKMVEAKFGILKATTGSGKTQCGIAMIKAHRRRALWLCHTADLLRQSRDRALQYMDESLIGTITNGRVNVGVGVTFATIQTMSRLELTQYRNYWDVIIVDECHRVAASADSFTMYQKVLNHLSARHKYGLTATPERSDGLIRATFAFLGGVAYEVPESAVADRVMGFKVLALKTGIDVSEECQNPDGTVNYVRMIGYLTEEKSRNRQIAMRIIDNKNHSCLILSDRLAQLEELIQLLPEDMRDKAVFINGKMTTKAAKAERTQALDDMRTGKKKYLFASYSLAKEGLDIPCLDRLFMASPCKYSAIVTQAVGRIRRVSEGKEKPVVYDFVDTIGFCLGAYMKRKTCYKKMGAEMEEYIW